MAGTGPLDFYALASDLMEACVDSLDTLPGFALRGAPERRYIAPEEPAWDCCEQLVVYSPGINDQLTSPISPIPVTATRHRTARISLVFLTVQVGRCVPTGTMGKGPGAKYRPPTAEALDASAQQVMADGWALYNGIYNRLYQGVLSSRCDEWAWDGVAPFSPSDDCGGWIIRFRAQLDGYGVTDPVGT